METGDTELDERLVQGLKQLKTQRLLPIVNHCFLIADSTPIFGDQRQDLVFLPAWFCRHFGIKDKARNLKKAIRRQEASVMSYVLLAFGVLVSATYPILLHKQPGTLHQRLYMRYLVNIALMLPIVLIETQRKITREMFSIRDALNPRALLTIYGNSTCLLLWNLCFGHSLQHTELSSTLFFSNLMLLFWVFNKIGRRASGISESEVNGSIVLLLGVLIFSLKQWISGFSNTNTTSLYQGHSMLGVGYALAASLSAAVFFVRNYEVTYYLPSYTSLLLMTLFALGNLELLNFGLALLYPASYNFKPMFWETFELLISSQSYFMYSLLAGSMTLFGTFGIQHLLLRLFDPLIVSLAFQFEPTVSLVFCILFGIQDPEYSSIVLYLLFLLIGNLLIVIGIRQFEDKYEGGIVGMSNEQRNNVRIDHLRELQLLGVGDVSETRSRG